MAISSQKQLITTPSRTHMDMSRNVLVIEPQGDNKILAWVDNSLIWVGNDYEIWMDMHDYKIRAKLRQKVQEPGSEPSKEVSELLPSV